MSTTEPGLLASLTDQERSLFAQCMNVLLGESFILRAHQDTRREYYFIDQHSDLFREYFAAIGWEFILDRVNGVCHVRSSSGAHRLSLNAVQTVIVLILRLLYEEQRKSVSLSQDVVVRVEDLQVQYAAARSTSRPLEKGVLRDTIGLLTRYNLIRVIDEDVTLPDCRLLVYPSIAVALSPSTVTEISAKLRAFASDNRSKEA